jgi:hypothetical protein
VSDVGKDELFTASGVSQAVNVAGAGGNARRKISLAPCRKEQRAFEASSPLKPLSLPASVLDQQPDDGHFCLLQQRLAKVKRHSADISKQLDKLNSLSDPPTDNGSE